MAEIEPPSFSLGLDFDLDFELPLEAPDSPTRDTSAPSEDKVEARRPETDPRPDSPPPLFRRLRRGPPTRAKEPPVLSREPEHPFPDSVDDDIEEFSSEELEPRPVEKTTPQVQSLCSGTKFSLRGRGVVTKQSSNEPCRKRKQDLDTPSTSSAAERGKAIFSDATMSPLRRFQLIDSDSDDMPDFGDAGVRGHGIKVTNKRDSNVSCSAAAGAKRSDSAAKNLQKVDLWKDFRPEETCSVSTPALDEFCQEYFRAPKDKTGTEAVRGKCQNQVGENSRSTAGAERLQQTDLGHALLPAHHYFFHDDPRIRGLVQSRLCHFEPLFPANSAGNQQHNASIIDYRSQFNNESSSKQKSTTTAKPHTSSRRAGNSSKKSSGKRSTNSTEEWVNPKSSSDVPTDASRRRVHASGGSVGQWYTDENGKKVYVSKNGQEFAGQSAYRCYKKESGGFGKSKRKRTAKRKK